MTTTETKICTKCGEEKPHTEFHLHKISKDGRHPSCAKCKNATNLKYWNSIPKEEQKIRTRRRRIKHRYGITQEEYEVIALEQNYKCAICKREDSAWKGDYMAIDHDHATGKVRGLLCGECNVGLGKFDDNFDILYNALLYLSKNTNVLGKLEQQID